MPQSTYQLKQEHAARDAARRQAAWRQEMDRYLESQGLLNYQTRGMSQADIQNKYLQAGIAAPSWLQQSQSQPQATQPQAAQPQAQEGTSTTDKPQKSGGSINIPAWMQGTITTYGKDSQKRLRGRTVGSGGNTYVESPLAPNPGQFMSESKRRLRGGGKDGVQLQYGNTTERATSTQPKGGAPDRVTGPSASQMNIPAWMQQPPSWLSLSGSQYVPGGLSQEQRDNVQLSLSADAKPWRIKNADGTWSYLQSDGSYLAATGTAGGGDDAPRNSYVNMPPLLQLPPPPAAPTTGYNGFGSTYRGWGRRGGGGGGGGGGSYSPNAPAWYMNLNSWNYGE